MDARESFKNIAEGYGWRFEYARRDYQNLIDATNFIVDTMEGYGVGETVFFLDPIVRSTENDGIRYQGNFMVLTNSDLDDTYEGKYTKFIEPILDIVLNQFRNKLRCHFMVRNWSSIEVINVFDFNADGLSVSFTLKG